jgi:hypothetical protein
MTDLTELMRRATDDLDVPVTELVEHGIRAGRRRRRRRTAGLSALTASVLVLAVGAGGMLAGQRQDDPVAPVAGGTPEQLLTTLKDALPASGRIHTENALLLAPYWLEARVLYDDRGHNASVVAIVTRGPAGPPACPPRDRFPGSCEIRPDGSALLRYSTQVAKGRLAGADVVVRRPDGISVSLEAGVLDGGSGHIFSLDQLTAMLDGQTWPEPAATGTPARDPNGEVLIRQDGRVLFEDEIVVSNPPQTPSPR